uniref:Lipase n=1 Tax=Glossina brevipalpis TaxID=37001 RepID=A0A1A9WZW0_9MUSC
MSINYLKYILRKYFLIINCLLYPVYTVENYLYATHQKDAIKESFLDTAQLIKRYKYPVETHHVITQDGYILGVHRIVNYGKPPVFLMHGLLDSSATWILMRPDSALGYYLYDKGYDVWMGNARGNRYSRNHTFLNPDTNLSYWRFSWHEIGMYDLPAMIDYVLAKTRFKKLTYFGHSQGTTAFWVLCSLKPEYNNKISIMHGLGPVAFAAHTRTSLLGIAQTFAKISKNKIHELLPHSYYLFTLCFASRMMESACLEIAHQILGRDDQNLNYTLFPVMLGHIPAGCNLKQVDHYLQLIESKRFCRYDYGPQRNMKYYGQPIPPDYPLENVTVPVGLYYTLNDELSSEIDVQNLASHLPNVVEDTLYPYKKWNHMTMLWGINARKLAHKRMLELTKQFINK